MLIEYVLGETQSYCLRITRSGASIVVIPAGRKRIDELVDHYLAAVRSRQAEDNPAGDLFSLLWEPVLRHESSTSLIVVPDGKLKSCAFRRATQ